MHKRMLVALILLTLCLCTDACSFSVSADSDTSAETSVEAADAALISEKMGISYAEAREIYTLLRSLGMSEGIKYVTAWTEPDSGKRYYRVRTSEEVYDLYPGTEGITVRDADGNAVFGAEPAAQTNETNGTDETDAAESAVTVVLNINTKKYHYHGCHSIDAMKESNKRERTVTDIRELFADGYSPCAVCAADDIPETEE